MIVSIKYLIIIVLLGMGLVNFQPQKPTDGLWGMEGKLVTHYFEDKTDSLSGPELFELQDENGIPIWFGRYIFKDVCISGVCKMISLWMFWDGAGNYLGVQVLENEPLTKSDHTEFEPEDYVKLEEILHDTSSILKDLKQEDLIIVPDTVDIYEAYEIDGYTAATQPALAEVVVKDAVYSCHTLWHTVYGPVQDTIRNMMNSRINEEFIAKMLSTEKPEYIYWSINSVKRNPSLHETFFPEFIQYIPSDNIELSKRAIEYFTNDHLTDSVIQNQITKAMAGSDMSIKYEILWKFINVGNVNDKAVLQLLQMFDNQQIGVGAYNLILRLVKPEHLNQNQQIATLIESFTENENGYVRNLTTRMLNEKKVN